MKKLTLFMLLLSCNVIWSQELNEDQKRIFEKFNLSTDDHRGVIFTTPSNQCDEEVNSERAAIELFFTALEMKDLTQYCIAAEPKEYYNKPLELIDVVNIYIAITK